MTPPIATSDRYLTPPQLARRWGIDLKKVLRWIRAGELHAVNLAGKIGGQPRWRISPEAVQEFELRRAAQPPAPKVSRRRRPERDPGWVEYF